MRLRRQKQSGLTAFAVAVLSSLALAWGVATAAQDLEHPAAWGDTHVGDPLPVYTKGNDCLFCHRRDIAPGWQSNAHPLSIRDVETDSPAIEDARQRFLAAGLALDVQAILGGDRAMRFLRPNGNDGQYSMLTASWRRTDDPAGTLTETAGAHWDDRLYGARCAGCHSTAVETRSRAFSSRSVDCFSCHGVVDPRHSTDTSLILLSEKRADAPRIVVSLCGQCHVRSGRSLSTGRPYPNQFVAGDNLFRDLSIDLSDAALASVNPIDRHVLENVRDVAVYGGSTTCLSCHDVHEASSFKHRKLSSADACRTCHEGEGDRWLAKSYEKSSATCRYGDEWALAKIELARLEQEAIAAAETQRVKRAIARFLGLVRRGGAERAGEPDESDAADEELP